MTLLIALAVAATLQAAGAAEGWTWPVDADDGSPAVVAAYDPPAHPWLPGHRGVDLAAPTGSRVRSAGDGVVLFAAPLAGRGVVSIAHPSGLRTTYEPVRAEVALGSLVRAGQVIGTLDVWPNGHATCGASSCLHWGARLGSSYVDPLQLLRPRPVRLLAPGATDLDVARSRPRVRLPIGPSQPFDRDVGVSLGGGDRGVPQHLLHRAQVSATLE